MEMYQNKIKDEKSSEMNELFFISGCSADHNKAISKLFDLLKNKKKEL